MNHCWSLMMVISIKLGASSQFTFIAPKGTTEANSKVRTTFNIDDWLAHTPKDILAKNFGVPESVFDKIPPSSPYIVDATVSHKNVTDAVTPVASGNSSFVYRTLEHAAEKIGGQGGVFHKIDSTNFPISKTIAATYVVLKPGGLRELHWHPNVCS